MNVIILPFPPASLSGHAKGHWRTKANVTKKWRDDARLAALEANPTVPEYGDIAVNITFCPPDKRSDRVNFPNRCKPIYDGIADALGVNDARFVPSFTFGSPIKPAHIIVTLSAAETLRAPLGAAR